MIQSMIDGVIVALQLLQLLIKQKNKVEPDF